MKKKQDENPINSKCEWIEWRQSESGNKKCRKCDESVLNAIFSPWKSYFSLHDEWWKEIGNWKIRWNYHLIVLLFNLLPHFFRNHFFSLLAIICVQCWFCWCGVACKSITESSQYWLSLSHDNGLICIVFHNGKTRKWNLDQRSGLMIWINRIWSVDIIDIDRKIIKVTIFYARPKTMEREREKWNRRKIEFATQYLAYT